MKKLLVSLIVLMFAAVPVSANMVVDGGFELGIEGNSYDVVLDGEFIGAWEVIATEPTGVLLCYNTEDIPPYMFWTQYMAEGTQFLHIGESGKMNTIKQTISGFTIGAKYAVSLAAISFSGEPGDYYDAGFIRVYNAAAESYDLDEIFDASIVGETAYMLYSTFEFTASNSALDLMIINPSPDYDPFPDIPEPAALTVDDISIVLVGKIVGTTVPTSLDVWENASQGPTSATFSVVINADPGVLPGDIITVTIDPNSNGNGEDLTVNGSTAPIDITFTDTNWDTPQTITVAAIDDTWADGQIEVDEVGFSLVSAIGDPNYDIAIIPSVKVTIHDDDSDAIIVSKTSTSLAEGGAGDSYTIELATDPTDPVTVYVAAGMVPISETDANMVPDTFDCQLTVNGGGSDTLVFTQGSVPQTVNISVVDDSLVEADPHTIIISNIVSTDDVVYSSITADSVSVDIEDNDVRAWSFGDDMALTVNNYSFEDPCLADGGSADFDPCNPIPGHGYWTSDEMKIINPTAGEWATMYKAGHQQAPDGEQVLDMANYCGTETAIAECSYLIEPGPVSYSFEATVGVPEPNDSNAYLTFYLSSNDPAEFGRIADPIPTFNLSNGDLVAGEWVEIKVCGVVDVDSDFIGGVLSIGVAGNGVQVDNWRLTLGNYPCEGCYQDNPTWDLTGPDGVPDCKVDLLDFSGFVLDWLECNLYPECVTGWQI